MKYPLSLITLFALSYSCSNQGYRPESIGSKMNRFQSRNERINRVPEVHTLKDFKIDKHSRIPASETIKAGANYSNKKLYFLTIFAQYNDLTQYSASGQSPEIKHCPSFHNSFLDAPKVGKSKKSYSAPINYKTLDEKSLVTFYPEFSLPIGREELRPRVIDLVKKKKLNKIETEKLIGRAVNNHLQKTFQELEILCDTGSSSNYYLYENLLSYVHGQGKMEGKTSDLNILFKTTLFSNRLLLSSLTDAQSNYRGLASVDVSRIYNREVEKRVGINWSGQYIHKIISLRKTLRK